MLTNDSDTLPPKKAKTVRKKSSRDPGEDPWLAQFAPVPDDELTERQRQFVLSLRAQYPTGRAGIRNGSLLFYALDPVIGRFSGLLPGDEVMSSRLFRRIRQMMKGGAK